jgi:iron(III) transport system permease protein
MSIIALVVYPLAMILIATLMPGVLNDRPFQASDLFTERFGIAWFNTLRLGVTVAMLGAIVGAPLAVLASYSKQSAWVDTLMSIPFLIPPFVASLAWTLAVGAHGYLSRLGLPGAALETVLFSFSGLSLLMAVHYAPIVYFACRAQIATIPNSLLWAARIAGSSPGEVVVKVLTPLIKPALLAGGFLAFASSIEEYGTPLVIGNRIGFPVVATEIGRLVSVYPINLTLASALGSTLLLLSGALYLLSHLVQRRSPATSGADSYPAPELLRPLVKRLLWLLVGGYALVAVAIPYSSILLTSLMRLVSEGPTIGNLTWQNYAYAIAADSSGFRDALVSSLALAALASCIGAFLGVAAARERACLPVIATIPVAVPAITMVVGYIRAWNAPWTAPLPLYGTAMLVGLFYTAQYLPYAVQYARAGFSAISPSYEWAARVHGASPGRAMCRILLPLLWPHCLAGAIMIFSISFRELVGSVLLRPAGVHTVSTFILREFDQGSPAAGMAMGMIAVAIALISITVTRKFGAHGRV